MDKIELVQKIGDGVCEGCGPDADCGVDPKKCNRIENSLALLDEYLSNKPSEDSKRRNLISCHDCGAKPGEIHKDGCDVERCSVCGGQRLQCDCGGHDKTFARWTGIWPGSAEAVYLGVDLNVFAIQYEKLFFVKPW